MALVIQKNGSYRPTWLRDADELSWTDDPINAEQFDNPQDALDAVKRICSDRDTYVWLLGITPVLEAQREYQKYMDSRFPAFVITFGEARLKVPPGLMKEFVEAVSDQPVARDLLNMFEFYFSELPVGYNG